jgi:osmoprotectant transport system permease protein
VLLLAVALGPIASPATSAESIAIGSKNFTENRLLAEIMAQLIEAHTDLDVERRIGLGGTTVVFSALTSGEIDIYPEYTGTGWAIHLGESERIADPLRVYLHVAREFERRFDVVWLEPFGFQNSYALAVRNETARELGLRSISDLLEHQDEISAGVSHEFLERPDGFPGLAEAYGLEIAELRGMEHGLAYQAIDSGRIDLIDTWTTDGKLLRYDIRILEDDRGFFPPYDAAPIVRRETLDRHPELVELINRLSFTIDDERMRRLNARVEEQGGTFEQVASEFLREQSLLDGEYGVGPGDGGPAASKTPGARAVELFWLTVEHLVLTGIAVFLAIAIAVPVGIALTRKERMAGGVLGAAGVIQTIPSLALLAFMIPIPGLGLGVRSAIAALFLYALLPILRNTYTGIREVDATLQEAARGMGLTDRQILTRVELPLAVGTIMAGIRTSAVISIGVATLAAFIGAGGLGDPIVTGLQLNDIGLVLSGAVPAALLALAVDFVLGRVEAALMPRGLRAD